MRTHLFLFISFLCILRSEAQETPEITNLMMTGFSGQNQVWSISQDDNKMLFFANSGGLLCFDGANWDSLQLPEKQIVRCVVRGKNGELFAGGYGEFGFWKRDEQGHLRYTSLSKTIPLDKVKKEEIWHILETPDAVFFQSFSTLYRYDYQKTEIITPPCNIMFLQKINDKCFIQGIGQGIFEYRKTGFEFCQSSDFFAKKTVVGILPYQEKLLVFTSNDGVFLYDFNKIVPWKNDLNLLFKKNQINRCLILKNGDIAIGTILNGLYFLDNQGNIKNHLAQNNGLQNNTVLSLFEDKNSFLWVGLDHGVDRVSLYSSLNYFRDLSGNIGTTYAAALQENKLYIGTNRGVFYKEGKSNFKFVEGTQGQVWFLQNIDNQLVCGHNEGTFIIPKQGAVQKISTITGGWTMKPLINNASLWVQGNYTGLALFRKNEAGKMQFEQRINGFSEPVKSLIIEDATHIWVANPYKGFYRLQLSNDLQKVENIEELELLGKKSAQIKATLTQINGTIYIQTKEGVFAYIQKNILQKVHQVGETPLINDDIHLFSGSENDWFGVSKEKVFWQNKNQKTYFFTSLITDYECVVSLDANQYLLGKENGYCILDKNSGFEENRQLAAPLISKVALSAQNIYPTEQNNLIAFPSYENGFVFSFSQPEVLNGVRFRYQLEGFDDTWSDWQSHPSKEFTNLPHGKYTFKVQSDVSDKITSFEFKILPPWYLTIWAKCFYVLLLLSGLYALEQWYVHRLARQKSKIEQEQLQVLEQLRLQNENEILQNTIQSKTKELASSAMNVVEKNQILTKIKETLNEVKKEAGAALPSKYYQRLINVIDEHLSSEQDWLLFETNFNEVHDQFFKKLIHDFPELTPSDLKLAAYLKMNLSSKELAPIFNISIRGMENKRYRLRQKLNLQAEDNVVEFLLKYP